jgi:leucyl aminopeptidase
LSASRSTPEKLSFRASSTPASRVEADLLVLPVFEGLRPGPGVRDVGRALGVDLVNEMRRHGSIGAVGDSLLIASAGRIPGRAVLLVGAGAEAAADPSVVREVAMRVSRWDREHREIATTLPWIGAASARAGCACALAEGFLLGSYRLTGYKHSEDWDREPAIRRVTALTSPADEAGLEAALARGSVSGNATNLARRLVDMPAIDATPVMLADEARRVARRHGLDARVWSRRELEREGFGGIIGVGRGSENEPRLVELSYRNAGRANPIALTGKGITFDSGGLDIKHGSELAWMKSDMAGAAAALAAIQAAAQLELRVNVDAVLPLAENMPGGRAIHPGDVLRHRGGETSEVADTDAEGRLILADALAYLSERRPAAILDSATLTDGSGLGAELSAAMGNDRELIAEVIASGEEAGESCWEIPLWDRYRKLIDSPVADIRNLGEHWLDSAMMAGLFLKDFVGEAPWVHLDTGSSAYVEHDTDLWPEGASGAPTRTFIRFLERAAMPSAARRGGGTGRTTRRR